MDHWDPAVTDGLATEREVILFNNAGMHFDDEVGWEAGFSDSL
jgi:hypothetical protein